jgi:hypothetical protein
MGVAFVFFFLIQLEAYYRWSNMIQLQVMYSHIVCCKWLLTCYVAVSHMHMLLRSVFLFMVSWVTVIKLFWNERGHFSVFFKCLVLFVISSDFGFFYFHKALCYKLEFFQFS